MSIGIRVVKSELILRFVWRKHMRANPPRLRCAAIGVPGDKPRTEVEPESLQNNMKDAKTRCSARAASPGQVCGFS
jgi:hypothetical protein